jgi:hypothetical protein
MDAQNNNQIIFVCKKCLFSDNTEQMVANHNKNCNGILNICAENITSMNVNIKLLNKTTEKLSAQLILERYKNKIYRSLIENNTSICISDILREEEDGLHVWTGTGILPVHVHELSREEKEVVVISSSSRRIIIEEETTLSPKIIKKSSPKIVKKPPQKIKKVDIETTQPVTFKKIPPNISNNIPQTKLAEIVKDEVIDSLDDLSKSRKQSYRSIKTYLTGLIQEEPTEQDRIDKISLVDSKIQDILEGFEDLKEVEKSFQDTFIALKQSRIYTKILSDLGKKRMSIFGRMSLASYKNLLSEQIRMMESIFREKNYTEKKSSTIISNGLTALESRLLSYGSYTQTHIEIDEIQKLEISLELEKYSPKEYVQYDSVAFVNYFHNYGLVLFSLKKNLERYLFNRYDFWNVVYLQLPKNTKDDPYSFYILERVTKEKRYWKMDCRLEDLSSNLISSILPIMVGMFRKLYKDVFGDNDFRNDFSSKCQITECDCEQLLQNIILISKPKEFYNLVREMVVNKATYIPTENDKFNLYGDDSLQRKRFHDKEDVDLVDIIKQLFDDITSVQAVDFYRSRTNLK